MLESLATLCALAGPPVFALGAMFVSGRGTSLPLPALIVAVLGPSVAGFGLLAWRRRRSALVAACELAVLWVFLAGFAQIGAPDPVAPYPFALPAARPPDGMSIQHVVTGVIRRTAAFAYRGGGFADRRTFTMNAVLVRHPAGDLLIDTGFGTDVASHLAQMPLAFRFVTQIEPRITARAALDAAGYDRGRLRAIVLTHAHWDHVSGADELAPARVWLPDAERTFMNAGWITAVARSVATERLHTYGFDDGPYLHYAASHDVFGDGAVVIVPAPGHTPGSVIIFVTLPSGLRFALLGDLVWQLEGVLLRSERPLIMRLGDTDASAVRAELARIAAMHARYPEIELVPAHDPRGYARIPALLQSSN